MKTRADVVFLNGSVITVDSQDRVCQGAAVAGNQILAAGTSAEMKALAGPETKIIDLKGPQPGARVHRRPLPCRQLWAGEV